MATKAEALEAAALALANEERAWSSGDRKIKVLEDLMDPKAPEFYRRMAKAALAAYWRKINGY